MVKLRGRRRSGPQTPLEYLDFKLECDQCSTLYSHSHSSEGPFKFTTPSARQSFDLRILLRSPRSRKTRAEWTPGHNMLLRFFLNVLGPDFASLAALMPEFQLRTLREQVSILSSPTDPLCHGGPYATGPYAPGSNSTGPHAPWPNSTVPHAPGPNPTGPHAADQRLQGTPCRRYHSPPHSPAPAYPSYLHLEAPTPRDFMPNTPLPPYRSFATPPPHKISPMASTHEKPVPSPSPFWGEPVTAPQFFCPECQGTACLGRGECVREKKWWRGSIWEFEDKKSTDFEWKRGKELEAGRGDEARFTRPVIERL